MASIQLDYSDITDIFKEKLHVDNIVKKISSIFLNQRYAEKINYKPYFQRNYVWDSEKASYFIESILLGTEIPPLVFFQSQSANEVIDGRQRYETIERFLNDRFVLNESGLHCLKSLAGKKYSQLDEDIREQFEETRIRILQFRVVNEPRLDEDREDKIKKEIFRRYNSGITPLGKAEIERATYISDPLSNLMYKKLSADVALLDRASKYFLPVSKTKSAKRDRINYLIMQIRTLLALPYIPIYSYARSSSRQEVIRKAYSLKISQQSPEAVFCDFVKSIEILKKIEEELLVNNHFLGKSKLFFEAIFWGISIIKINNHTIEDKEIKRISTEIITNSQDNLYWERIINNPSKDITVLFDPTGSHYYSSTNNRFNFVANLLSSLCKVDFSKNLKNPTGFQEIISVDLQHEELKHYQLNKPIPETLTIEDIISDMQKDRFMVRPEYQRSEVKNVQKASYLMESIMLGINIPPIFVYKRSDKVKEVIDGQQRLLTILGFLGKTYKDENGTVSVSNKDLFKLSKLRILTELNGLNVNTIPDHFVDKILEFPIDVIEINQDINPEFSQTDLFARLNTKPYPIKENTFEMWNAYIDKEIILRIRKIADKYETVIFKTKDTRMKVEELIASLAYLHYRISNTGAELKHMLNVYKKQEKICARIASKETVTSTLSEASNKNPSLFLTSVNSVEEFAEKIDCLIDHNPEKLKELFSHSRKGTQHKTDQNYYFLWAMLQRVSKDDVIKHKQLIFDAATKLFSVIQKSSDDYGVEDFFKDIEQFSVQVHS